MQFSNNSVFNNIILNIQVYFLNYVIVCARPCQLPQRVLLL